MGKDSVKVRVRRPTEERALGAIARESIRLGITQAELFSMFFRRNENGSKPAICHCIYCRRRREREISFTVVLGGK